MTLATLESSSTPRQLTHVATFLAYFFSFVAAVAVAVAVAVVVVVNIPPAVSKKQARQRCHFPGIGAANDS